MKRGMRALAAMLVLLVGFPWADVKVDEALALARAELS